MVDTNASKQPAATADRKRERGSNSFASWLLVSIVVLQIGLMAAMYVQNVQMAALGGEKTVRIQHLEAKILELQAARAAAAKENMPCPPCEHLHEQMEKALKVVHDDFEKTADRLANSVNNLQSKVNQYGSKFDNLIKKVQNNPLLKQFGGL
ncbi:hypothetical protein TGME49_258730 [Toxoplasma gondii ME49]|uniref:Transmembrane protein n=14 Tax=Toxoplasma gondii TaxID=5811 RepID=A0A125YGK5_TOXGG|nr:hypothetical protein TGME49_258730 [Toxoplasma gondii ME49]EPR62950.1 hypothetical protein TGGT1_258730 [Toxoplasma gondii GT1]ESS32226.1 putative transmembrane protein [Toxoplasma gondii VEG]KAF4641322.1 hypothetical protein TGRH88_071320 [Toxoplasma gondii]KFG29347.1 putative transmembrane protein [Toxoplasma gondii p89]KFG33858.1 putative transmembrane protein [Toxoplasma gondii GAB2-2007-GAL-DOM2]KFG38052.1 putative transmembrane protein [Toxoplasma gondii FOU]KFG65148.1 putative tran|eukprot:XP_002365087.1 hypothetical protein TGME49_258730 [Toxoplasma gondii ME49]